MNENYSTFDSQPVDDTQKQRMDCVRNAFKFLLGEVLGLCPPGRERSECVTNLEYASMRAIRAITHTPVMGDSAFQNSSQRAVAAIAGASCEKAIEDCCQASKPCAQ